MITASIWLEDHRFTAFARDRQGHQQRDTPPVRIALTLLQRLLHVALEGPAVLLHPQHHLHDQHTRDQHHCGLEIILRVTGEHFGETDQRRAKCDRRDHTGRDATPQVRQTAARIVVAIFQPRVQDADDQQGLNTFPPHDE
jgi:hypothetical protein